MFKSNIYDHDGNPVVQDELWEEVSQLLIEDGWLQREEWETDEQFVNRLWDMTADYIHRHNTMVEYKL